ATGTGAGDDVGIAVAGKIRGRHEHAAWERWVVREHAGQLGRDAAAHMYHADMRCAARTSASNDLRDAVAIDVAGRDLHAAHELPGIGVEAGGLGQVSTVVAERPDVWAAAGSGASDDVGHA